MVAEMVMMVMMMRYKTRENIYIYICMKMMMIRFLKEARHENVYIHRNVTNQYKRFKSIPSTMDAKRERRFD